MTRLLLRNTSRHVTHFSLAFCLFVCLVHKPKTLFVSSVLRLKKRMT